MAVLMIDAGNLPQTRADAKAKGTPHYYTGFACKRGHIAIRLTNSCHCVECLRESANKRYHETKNEKRDDKNAKARRKYLENIEDERIRLKEYSRKRRANNPGHELELGRKWREKNPLASREAAKRWRANNPDRARESNRASSRKIRETPMGRLRASISCGIRQSIIQGAKAGRSWETLVGYTVDDLRTHLERQFTEGMSWENYGEWEIDHVIPIAAHNFTTTEDIDFKR